MRAGSWVAGEMPAENVSKIREGPREIGMKNSQLGKKIFLFTYLTSIPRNLEVFFGRFAAFILQDHPSRRERHSWYVQICLRKAEIVTEDNISLAGTPLFFRVLNSLMRIHCFFTFPFFSVNSLSISLRWSQMAGFHSFLGTPRRQQESTVLHRRLFHLDKGYFLIVHEQHHDTIRLFPRSFLPAPSKKRKTETYLPNILIEITLYFLLA